MILPQPTESPADAPGKGGGPKTAEGKKRSRMNAMKHGLSGDAIAFAEGRLEEYEARLAAWRGSFAIDDEHGEWTFRTMVAETLRGERCRTISYALTQEYARRADETWENDARRAVKQLAENLAKKPVITAAELRGTRFGCEHLAECWAGLIRVLEEVGDWDDAQKHLAMDLLGVDPRLRMGLHLFRIGAADLDRGLLNARAEFAAAEVAALHALIQEKLDVLDGVELECARAGVFFHEPKLLANLRRYEKDSVRRQNQLLRQLRRQPSSGGDVVLEEIVSKTAPSATPKPGPEPIAKSEPKPQPAPEPTPKPIPTPDPIPTPKSAESKNTDARPESSRPAAADMPHYPLLPAARIEAIARGTIKVESRKSLAAGRAGAIAAKTKSSPTRAASR